jgi:hypothetical protein
LLADCEADAGRAGRRSWKSRALSRYALLVRSCRRRGCWVGSQLSWASAMASSLFTLAPIRQSTYRARQLASQLTSQAESGSCHSKTVCRQVWHYTHQLSANIVSLSVSIHALTNLMHPFCIVATSVFHCTCLLNTQKG